MNKIAQTIFDIFSKSSHEIFLVGGIVRDSILNKQSQDYDFATSALPEDTIKVLETAGLKAIPIGIEFGTIQTIIEETKVEITTYRCAESYVKGSRHPAVKFGINITEDLARRDFTFNAMAMGVDGSIIDPFNGRRDLEEGIIRTPIDPSISFGDDPLRMLRACRFTSRCIGQIASETFTAMKAHQELVKELSAERVFEEMTKILVSPRPSLGLNVMADTGLLRQLFPELQDLRDFKDDQGKYHHLSVWDHTIQVVEYSTRKAPVAWACLFHDIAKPFTRTVSDSNVHFYGHAEKGSDIWNTVADRLKTSTDFKEHVGQLIFEHQNLRGEMGWKGTRRLVHRLGDRLNDLFALRWADLMGHNPKIIDSSVADLVQLKNRCEDVRNSGDVNATMPKGMGNQVAQALGIKPGPELGVIMRQLQQKIVDGELNSTSNFIEAAKTIKEMEDACEVSEHLTSKIDLDGAT